VRFGICKSPITRTRTIIDTGLRLGIVVMTLARIKEEDTVIYTI